MGQAVIELPVVGTVLVHQIIGVGVMGTGTALLGDSIDIVKDDVVRYVNVIGWPSTMVVTAAAYYDADRGSECRVIGDSDPRRIMP